VACRLRIARAFLTPYNPEAIMPTHSIAEIIRRELAAYPHDATPSKTAPGIADSTGTLVLHLAGNPQHDLGAVSGGTGDGERRGTESGTAADERK
jgi:hypothetical protein